MISVIIPIYNEGKGIAKCINSILPQLTDMDELIIVASGCTDNTVEEVSKMMQPRDGEESIIRLIVQKERRGKASAINLAVEKANGAIIIQSDGDVILEANAIANLLLCLNKEPDIVAVSGHPLPEIPKENVFYDWTIMSYNKIHELRMKEMAEGTFWHMSGYLCAFRKSAFEPLPFAKGAVDALMALKLKEKGKIVYAPYAIVDVKAPTNTKDFIAQKARVRAGFMALPTAPRTAQSEISSFLPELFKINITHWHKFIYSGFVYLYSWIKAKQIKDKTLNEIWKVPESTK